MKWKIWAQCRVLRRHLAVDLFSLRSRERSSAENGGREDSVKLKSGEGLILLWRMEADLTTEAPMGWGMGWSCV
jgi:hypothetical protein